MSELSPEISLDSLRRRELEDERQTLSIGQRIRGWLRSQLTGSKDQTPAPPKDLFALPVLEEESAVITDQETVPVVAKETERSLLSDFRTWLNQQDDKLEPEKKVKTLEAFALMLHKFPDVKHSLDPFQQLLMPTREIVSAMMWAVMPNHSGPYNAVRQQLARSGIMPRLEAYVNQQLGRKEPSELKLS